MTVAAFYTSGRLGRGGPHGAPRHGDVTHFSTIAQFDQAKDMMSSARTVQVLVLPGEHDAVDDSGQK